MKSPGCRLVLNLAVMCYVMLHCVVLCFVVLCSVVLSGVVLSYVFCFMLCWCMLWCDVSCCTLCCVYCTQRTGKTILIIVLKDSVWGNIQHDNIAEQSCYQSIQLCFVFHFAIKACNKCLENEALMIAIELTLALWKLPHIFLRQYYFFVFINFVSLLQSLSLHLSSFIYYISRSGTNALLNLFHYQSLPLSF